MADESIASRVKGRSIRRMTFYGDVERVVRNMMEYLDSHPLFRHHTIRLQKQYPTEMGYGIELGLNEETYARLFFYRVTVPYPVNNASVREEYMETYGLSAEIPSVYSSVGRGTGFFLLHLAMMVAILSGAMEIKLDNDVDDPARAVRGIYQLFEPDPRSDTIRSLRQMTPEQRNTMAERVHYVGKDSMREIERILVQKVGDEIKKEEGREEAEKVWREDAVGVIRGLFRVVSGVRWRGGRGRKSRKRVYRKSVRKSKTYRLRRRR